MDILSIEGENIASLAKPFSIDLENGDLAGCGLFAITGKTGAGKSSLLDAMCLALYGDCPRLGAAGVNDTVPDASGEDIQSSDPRTILRRGTAAGHAVVRFRGRDGIDYEASWSVRRARGKPTGRLQNQERSLKRLSDGQILENQIRRVNERVVELTGLTYEEFRRSVLLAQGDFDSFLSAKTSERAAILEKVTGTGLYREISRRVYANHQDAEGKVHDLELKLGEHTVLSEEEKAEITDRQTVLAAKRKDTEAALKAIQVDLDHYSKRDEARVKIATATRENEDAIKAWTDAEPDRDRLAVLRKAASVRGEFREDRDAIAAKAKGESALTEIEGKLKMAVLEESETRRVRDEAKASVDILEARFKELGPVWSQAERLDAEIGGAEREHGTALSEVQECEDALQEARQEAEEKRTRRGKIVAAMEQKQAKIAAEKAGSVFRDHWDMLRDRVGRRIACAKTQRQAADEVSRIEKDIAGKRDRIQEIDDLVEGFEVGKKALMDQRQAQSEERAEIVSRDPKGRLSRLMTSRISVRGLFQLARSHKAKAGEIRTHDEARAKLNAERIKAEEGLARAVTEIANAESRIKALEAPADMAEAAASRQAQALRRHLVDGEPCPVCQSTHHPVHDDAATADLAKRLRADLDAARSDLTTHSRAKVTLEGIISDAKTRLSTMDEMRTDMIAALGQLADDYAKSAFEEADGPVSDQVPATIEVDAGPIIERLDALQAKMNGWKEVLEAECERLDDLDTGMETQRAQIEAEERKIAALRDERTGLADAIGPQRTDLSRAEGNRDKARDDIAGIDSELGARIVAPEDLGLPAWSRFEADAAGILSELETRRAGYMSDVDTIRKAEDCKAQLDNQIAILESKEKTARDALGKAQQKAQARKDVLDGLRKERAGMLDGQPTGAHRTAFNDKRQAAGKAHGDAVEAHGKATETKAGFEASKRSATAVLGAAGERARVAHDTLTAASRRIAIPVEDLAALLSETREDNQREDQAPIDDRIAQLEKTLAEIETRKIEVGRDLETRQNDLASIEEAHSPEEAREILDEKKSALQAQDEGHAKEEGELNTRLALDAEARRKQAAIIKDLETAKGDRDTWAAVNDTVGSASGDRFSQLAQEVTLSILVEQANHHLAEIKPRYRLALGDGKLSLHVVDEDMAGEIRSTRSLSGGERFLVSLSLALALSSVGGTGAISGTLFIDEGFGTLDADSLELAINALEALQAQGRTVGVISHVQAMKDRIPMQVQVQAQGDGSSEVVVAAS